MGDKLHTTILAAAICLAILGEGLGAAICLIVALVNVGLVAWSIRPGSEGTY